MQHVVCLRMEAHPEAVKLAEEVRLLREELVRLLQEREDLVSIIIPNLEARYYTAVGRFQYDLFSIECAVRRMKRQIELVQAAINRSERIRMGEIERILDQEQAAWTTLINEMAHKLELAKNLTSLPRLSVEAQKEIKRLYYELAKKVHPDLHHGQSERLNSLWLQIASAYQNGNLEGMKALVLVLEDDQAEPGTSTGNDWIDQRERLKKQLEHQALGLASLKKTFPYTIRKQLEDPEWVNSQIAEIQSKQKAESDRLKELTWILDNLPTVTLYDELYSSH